MSGILTIRGDAIWMPQSWIYDAVLLRLSKILQHEDAELSEYLLRSQTFESVQESFASELNSNTSETYLGLGRCDLRDMSPERFRRLLKAVCDVSDDAFLLGPSSISPSTMFFGFATGISLCKALLRTDERSIEDPRKLARIFLKGQSAVWFGPAWAYDMILEHLATDLMLQLRHSHITRKLLAVRTIEHMEHCDLYAVTDGNLDVLAPMLEWLLARYGEGKGYDAYAPAFYNEFSLHVVHLSNTLLRRVRAN